MELRAPGPSSELRSGPAAVVLAAGLRVLVEEDRAEAATSELSGGGQARRSGADDQRVGLIGLAQGLCSTGGLTACCVSPQEYPPSTAMMLPVT